jgi:hypothetical protein
MEMWLSALSSGRHLPPKRFLLLNSVKELVNHKAVAKLEGLGKLENPITLEGIEPVTFSLGIKTCLLFMEIYFYNNCENTNFAV